MSKGNIIDYAKFIAAALVVSLVVYSWFYESDPFMYGCVYDKDFGKKISCVNVDFNERDDPGSMQRAFRTCMRELEEIGRDSGVTYEIDGCVDSEGPYN